MEGEKLHRIIITARPVQSRGDVMGTIEQAPNHPGIYIPYISALHGEDKVYVPNFIRTHLYKILGENLETAGSALSNIFSQWNFIGVTEPGKQMVHLAFCLNIALQCEAVCFPLFSNSNGVHVYEGCLVLGYKFKVMVCGAIYTPIPFNLLIEKVRESDTHTTSILQILEIVGDKGAKEADVSTMRALSKTLRTLALTEEQRKSISGTAKHLTYNTPYWRPSQENLLNCIQHIVDGKDFTDNTPMHYLAIFSDDISIRCLSAFGPTAPSLNIPQGQVITVKEDANIPEPFYFTTKGLIDAGQDWNKFKSSLCIVNKSSSEGAKRSLKKINIDAVKKGIWDCLKQVAKAANKSGPKGVNVIMPELDDEEAGY
jgi:hypothetical protein